MSLSVPFCVHSPVILQNWQRCWSKLPGVSLSVCLQLRPERFDMLFQSPLRRSSHTASIIWGDRSGDVTTLPSLREIDLYNFQVGCWTPLASLVPRVASWRIACFVY